MNLYIKDSESRLNSALERLSVAKDSTAICFFLSQFKNNVENSDVISIAISLIRDHFKKSVGDIYSFGKGDIVVVYKGHNHKLINDIIYQIKYLFSEDNDQMSFVETALDNCCKIYDSQNWDDFIKYCSKLLGINDNKPNSQVFHGSLIDLFSTIIEDFIQNIKWDSIIRHANVYKYANGGLGTKIFEEIFVDVDALSYVIGKGFDITSNIYLRNYFKELLDIKLLLRLVTLIKKNNHQSAYLLSLSINTLLSKEFDELSHSLPETVRKRIIISLSASDIFENLSTYMALREKLVSYNFKLCLDRLDYLTFLQLDRKNLGFDLFKISKIKAGDLVAIRELEQQMISKIKATGESRVVLAVSNKDDMLLGKSLGLSLFQTE
jgi:hypothetical protein